MNDDVPSLAVLSRRRFLQAASVMSAAIPAITPSADGADRPVEALVDTNVSIGSWPFRQLPLADTTSLVEKLRDQGVTQAWAGSFDALLHKDISQVNAQLVDECARHGRGVLIPMGAINPTLPGWKEDLRRCVEEFRMPGIRLHPNYHGYKLSESVFEQLLGQADERNLLVQISMVMEDDRTLHPLVNVPATEATGLTTAMKLFKGVRVQLLNALRNVRSESLFTLAASGVCFEIAMLEGAAGVASLLEKFPLDRLCFGSHAPFYYFESARLKLQESDLAEIQMKAICSGNTTRLLAPR